MNEETAVTAIHEVLKMAQDAGVFREQELQDYFFKWYLGGVRPQKATSFHCAIWPKDLKQHQDRWDVLLGTFRLKESPEIAAARDSLEEIAGKPSRGQRYQNSPAERREIELYAMKRAEGYYRGEGWTVENVSAHAPYDLCCRRADDELHVEVKGTKSAGDEILLTRNEVDHARTAYPQVALFVVFPHVPIGRPTSSPSGAIGGTRRQFTLTGSGSTKAHL